LVTLSPRVRSLSAQLTVDKSGMADRVRAIYDYVRTTLHYDKSGTGWGNGDTEWACDSKRGNCTDYHSLLMSLCRASGIPARFVIGYSVPSGDHGGLSGYHCWSEVFIPHAGWLPVDASEASKDPRRKDELFFGLDGDRFQLTTGRDLHLPGAQAGTLNYFVYPYAEVDGKSVSIKSTAAFTAVP
jgi:transglutaminase-like putative cysteine protease